MMARALAQDAVADGQGTTVMRADISMPVRHDSYIRERATSEAGHDVALLRTYNAVASDLGKCVGATSRRCSSRSPTR